MLNQKLQQKLLQKLSPQQIQLMKLLQVPTVALEQRIKQEIEENPALEDASDADSNVDDDVETGLDTETDNNDSENDDINRDDDDFDLQDYLDDDETPAYRYQANNRSADDEVKETPVISTTSFHQSLNEQLGLRKLSSKQQIIGLTIIGNLDEAGYLQRGIRAMVDDFAFSQGIEVTEEEIEDVLEIIQQFDPPGVGARNLKECLLLQLKRKDTKNPSIATAIMLLDKFFDEFTKKHYDRIAKKAEISEEELKQAIAEILKLNPKPGGSMSDTGMKGENYIIPDFIITNEDGKLELKLNSRNTPELRINRTYQEMLESFSGNKNKNDKSTREAILFVKQKIDSARWFIDAIKQRQNTLYFTMKSIMDYQQEYFLTGDETRIKPMILKDIADRVNLDISTVSRVANSKYVQTPYGTFQLKSFFSESLSTDTGEEVSTREVKKILSDCVENENKRKPLTDDELAKILKDKGYYIARRTVAKYREQLGIPVARLRKEL